MFPSLAGLKWNDALNVLSNESNNDYEKLNEKIMELVEYRNKFIHQGHKIFEIDSKVAEDCVKNTHLLIQLFVDLHNKYVHKEYLNK